MLLYLLLVAAWLLDSGLIPGLALSPIHAHLQLAPVIGAALIGGAGSLLGGLLGRRRPQNTQTTQHGTSTTFPTFDPAFAPLLEPLIGAALGRLRNRGGLPAGYEAQGIQGINSSFDFARSGLQNRLASSGQQIAGAPSPASVLANTNLETARGAQIGQFETGLPNVARDFEDQDIAQALGVLGLGRGSTSTTNMTGTNLVPGQSFGEGLGQGVIDLGSILGLLYGQQGSQSKKRGSGPTSFWVEP